MSIYCNLNLNIQYKIDKNIEKNVKLYVKKSLLAEIINYRKRFFVNNFRMNVSKTKSFKTDLYYFLNIPRANWGIYGIKQKFINFMDKLIPFRKHDINNATNSYDNLYMNFYKTVKKRNDFIDLCLLKLSMDEVESFFIYTTKVWYYYNFMKVNRLSIHNVINNFI